MSNPQDEREAFEADVGAKLDLRLRSDGEYVSANTQICWEAWQASAALANQRAEATPEQRVYLAQAVEMLEDHALNQRKAGNCSIAAGAEASAHVIKRMLAAQPEACPHDVPHRYACEKCDGGRPEAVPQGGQWKMVPVEPTPEMVEAAYLCTGVAPHRLIRAVKAMLAAAPPSPQPPAAPAVWRWKSKRGEPATRWVEYHAADDAAIRAQVAEAGGTMEYAYTPQPPAVQALVPLTDDMVLRAARELCKIHAGECQVNEQDTWNIYADQFKRDARAALEAAHGIGTAKPAQPEGGITAPAGGGEGV